MTGCTSQTEADPAQQYGHVNDRRCAIYEYSRHFFRQLIPTLKIDALKNIVGIYNGELAVKQSLHQNMVANAI